MILAAIIGGLHRHGLFRGSHAHPVVHSMAMIQVFFLAFCGASATVRNQRVFLLHLLQYLQHLELANIAVSGLVIRGKH